MFVIGLLWQCSLQCHPTVQLLETSRCRLHLRHPHYNRYLTILSHRCPTNPYLSGTIDQQLVIPKYAQSEFQTCWYKTHHVVHPSWRDRFRMIHRLWHRVTRQGSRVWTTIKIAFMAQYMPTQKVNTQKKSSFCIVMLFRTVLWKEREMWFLSFWGDF